MAFITSKARSYWDSSKNVWYPGCEWSEAHVAPARDVIDGEVSGWAWWVGTAYDPIVGGPESVDYERASFRGIEPTRVAAEAAAEEAFIQMAEESY